MNQPKFKNRGQKLIKSPEEAEALARAQRLASKGDKVFGQEAKNTFNVEEDLASMAQAGFVNPETLAATKQQKEDFMTQKEKVVEQARRQLDGTATPKVEENSEQQDPELGDRILTVVLPQDPGKAMVELAKWLEEVATGLPIHGLAPSYEQLKEWKTFHGSLYILPLEDYVFIFRYLKRQEYNQLLADETYGNKSASDQEDDLCNRCILWPKLDDLTKAGMPAGLTQTIAKQIDAHSLFLDPRQVIQAVVKI